MNFPLGKDLVLKRAKECGISDFSTASIREIVKLASMLEKDSGRKFVHMEMGVPGLKPPAVGTEAEIKALRSGVAAIYPSIEGIPELKTEIARFAKLFLDIEVSPQLCVPTVGSMQGSFASFMVSCRRDSRKDITLFIDPGFPVQKQQHHNLGLKFKTFDVYAWRGSKLREKLESYLKKGNISTIVYSSPNNPSWICFSEKELKIIGELATRYDAVVLEDLAYFAMDFRKDYSKPGRPPFQPTVAKFTQNYVLLVSSSKAFSYAGQRIGSMIVSEKLFHRRFPDLRRHFASDEFGHALVYGALYSMTSGTSHSAQFALAAMMKAANEEQLDFVEHVKEYGVRSGKVKKYFREHGFKEVYEKDESERIADGFYFTVSYPGMSSHELIFELVRHGVSAISLKITGSERHEGIRACVSQLGPDNCKLLRERLAIFQKSRKIAK